ncbi:quinone-dependent dihydroorotate dehydrogenase [Crateriforma conspicua]|uniref:Dihydroorotate dehydrogenase (quinone) n=1 Tax=Crateriforma conspicua TaxID=2527996 RepID=A0A5C6FWG8_9PLAN|nr:quinone-dependent dihydroorotate dehydrogenase [Crateriforma conspicua]TWU67492.1 Dihydroorotate dehydrogenase (quinone) [Crateriforma conspicua]
MTFYGNVVRPILFTADAEWVHHQTVTSARRATARPWLRRWLRKRLTFDSPRLVTTFADQPLANPIGLAAGWDKSGEAVECFDALGFGFGEIGSISARVSLGNPKPRLFRLPQDRSIVVNYGLPNDGCQVVADRLARQRPGCPLGINVVPTNDGVDVPAMSLDDAIEDFALSTQTLQPHASYITLNLSCPNVGCGEDHWASAENIGLLLQRLAEIPMKRPVVLKMRPTDELARIDGLLQQCDRHPFVRGFMANLPSGKPDSLRSRRDNDPDRLASMPGAVAGPAQSETMSRWLSHVHWRMPAGRYQLIGGGGVFTGDDAYQRIRMGASVVQIYTAMIYEGPGVVARINRRLDELLRRDGFANVSEAVGTANAASTSRR